MGTRIAIVICYVRGTSEMMRACVESIVRHTHIPVRILVVAQEGNLDEGLFRALECFHDTDKSVSVVEVPNRFVRKGHEHGCLLDKAIMDEVSDGYVVTMDSDTIPIADGWLVGLLNKIHGHEEVCTSGILHPWEPPPANMKKTLLEYRVRRQHCWETTHVACQVIRMDDARQCIEGGLGYSMGDDTGLGMVDHLKQQGRKCVGYMPTRCPKSMVPFDAEFNRYSCVVYGDAVVHVGGFTRETVDGDDGVFRKAFAWAAERILEDGEADFLLELDNSYVYTLDREEEVAAEKMQRLFGLRQDRMTV